MFNSGKDMEKLLEMSVRGEAGSQQEVSDSQLPPIDPVGLVGLAWILSNNQPDDAMWVNQYFQRLQNDYNNDRKATDFLRTIIPEVYGVAAKIKSARITVTRNFEKFDELKEAQVEQLKDMVGLGRTLHVVTVQ